MSPPDLRVGQRVLINADWSSFLGRRGTIAEVRAPLSCKTGPMVMLLLDGETKPMAFEAVAFEVVVGEQSEPNLTGAE